MTDLLESNSTYQGNCYSVLNFLFFIFSIIDTGIICVQLLCELFIPRNRNASTIIHSYGVSTNK